MTVTYRFFSNGDYYNQPDFAKLMKDAVGTGVVPNVEDELEVIATTPATMSVLVSLGRGYINGYSFDIETNPESVPIAQADGTYGRIDTIVARLSVTANKWVEIDAVTGTPSANPVPPTLQQDDETWEMPLADVLVVANAVSVIDSNITDRRIEICDPQFKIDALTGVKVNDTTQPVTNHVADITVPDGSKSAKGVLKVGDNLSVSSGTVSVPLATTSSAGAVKVGSNLNVSSGTISVPLATNSSAGVVKVGEGLSISSGVLSVTKGAVFMANVGQGKDYSSISSALNAGFASGAVSIILSVYEGTYTENIEIGINLFENTYGRIVNLFAEGSFTINGSIDISAPITFKLLNPSANVTLNAVSGTSNAINVGAGAEFVSDVTLYMNNYSGYGLRASSESIVRANIITCNNCDSGVLAMGSFCHVGGLWGNTYPLISAYCLCIVDEFEEGGRYEKGNVGILFIHGQLKS